MKYIGRKTESNEGVQMNTVVEQIAVDLGKIKNLAEDFLLHHSQIRYCGQIEGVIGFSSYEWVKIDHQGQQIQARLYKEYSCLAELMETLISELPSEYQRTFKECKGEVLSCIEQNRQVWDSSTTEVFEKVHGNLDKQFELVKNLYSNNDGGHIFVPDTNAILINPHLDKWTFEDAVKFEIILTPSVLSELDQLKMVGRNEEVRNKAQSIIRSIKEYRRRGRLTEGVTLKKNVSMIRALAVEPEFEKTFSWLQEDNKDDRLLASFMEIMKGYPNSVVILVTSDINLQNKAEYARLPFLEPPKEE